MAMPEVTATSEDERAAGGDANPVEGAVRAVDRFQQRHVALAFPFAVVKKFGDDGGGVLATSLAYSTFVAVFPLLLLFVTVLGFILGHSREAEETVSRSVLAEFPILGDQLVRSLEPLRGSGLALAVGLGGLAWGGLGVTQQRSDRRAPAHQTTDIGQQLEGEPPAFDRSRPLRAGAAQQPGGPLGPETAGRAAGDELSQGHMQPTGRLGAQRDQVVVAVDHHPDHRGVVLHPHRPEPAVPQPGDGGGQRVVRVVPTCLGRAQQPDPRGQCGGHVDDVLTRCDELLGQQLPSPAADSTAQLRSGPSGSAQANSRRPDSGQPLAAPGRAAARPGRSPPPCGSTCAGRYR
jgi:hypothetical protein